MCVARGILSRVLMTLAELPFPLFAVAPEVKGALLAALLLPNYHRADSALRSQAVGGMGVCASVAPPAFGCWLGWVNGISRPRAVF